MPGTMSPWRRFWCEFCLWLKQRRRKLSAVTESAIAPTASYDPLFDWVDAQRSARQEPLFEEGQTLAGRFQIVRFLGRGGMGEVYEACNKTLGGSRVALKTLNAQVRQRQGATMRFMREVELAQRVTHPNICRIHDIFPYPLTEAAGAKEQGYFLTMQLLHGESLAAFLKEQRSLPLEEALPILRAMAEALDAAHKENVVHRDLKPGNVILVKRSDGWQPVITDFGLAALVSHSPELRSDASFASYTRAGTPDYSAPEQLSNGQTSPASDIYSLGVVALEMLSGDTALSGLAKLPDVPRAAIERCLKREPKARFASAPDFVAELAGRPLKASASRPKMSRRAAIAASAGLAAGSGLTYFENFRGARHALSSLSILPFELLKSEIPLPGFQEELVRVFLRSRKVRLVSPYSTLSLRAPFSVEGLAKMLPSEGFLLGAITSAAIVVRLFHRNGAKLWERRFPRTGSDFQLHQQVAAAVIQEVGGPADALTVTTPNYIPSDEGYRAYVAARSAIRGQTDADLDQAEALFMEAIHHDGGFAQAFSGLGYVLFLKGGERTASARTAIDRALELDPSHAEAHMVKGIILHRLDWQWDKALVEFKRAIDLEPYNFAVHDVYGGCLSDRGFFPEGLPEIKTAVDYDPLSYTAKFAYGIMSAYARRFDFAIQQLELGLALAKSANVVISRPYNFLGACWLMKGEREKAYSYYLEGLKRQPSDPTTLCHFVYGAAQSGHMEEARASMNQLLQLPAASSRYFYKAMAFAGLGDLDKSLDCLEDAVKWRDPDAVATKVHLYCDPLQAQPRFQAVLKHMNLA